MHRLYILLTVMVVVVGAFFAGHEAVAKLLTGAGGNDELVGTNEADRLKGRAGNDRLSGRVGNDHLWGGRGSDKIWPGKGDDLVIRARPPWRGLHRLRAWSRPGRDHTPRR
jgi:hypothetical protein